MKKLITLAGIAALGVLWLENAQAVTPCKMYFKADIGYTFVDNYKYNYKSGIVESWNGTYKKAMDNAKDNKAEDDKSKNIKKANATVFGLGFGFNLSEFMRTDLMISYAKMKNRPAKTSNEPKQYKESFYVEREDLRFMANLYYDFNNKSSFTPFVGLGAGINTAKGKLKLLNAKGEVEATPNADGSWSGGGARKPNEDFDAWYLMDKNGNIYPKPTSASDPRAKQVQGKTKTELAYQGILGLAYKTADNIYIDFMYKLENLPQYKNFKYDFLQQFVKSAWIPASPDKPEEGGWVAVSDFKTKRTWKHNFTLGLRVQF